MTNQTAIAVTVEVMAERLKLMVQNGRKLSNEEALALGQYALVTGLDPFSGECYYLQNVGPGPGIAGWRRKAEEQLEYEARKAAEPLARFWCDYVDAEADETGNLAAGDIAVKAVLHDTLTKGAWEKRTLSHYIELVKAKIEGDAWTIAQALAGPEPTWSAVGIVRAGENFGGDKMPRYERACKRAEKAAIRKRFPRVHLPEPMGFDPADVVDSSFVSVPEVPEAKSTGQLLSELGYADPNDAPPNEKAWKAWDFMVDKAQKAGIEVMEPVEDVTTGQLRQMYTELKKQIEAQP